MITFTFCRDNRMSLAPQMRRAPGLYFLLQPYCIFMRTAGDKLATALHVTVTTNKLQFATHWKRTMCLQDTTNYRHISKCWMKYRIGKKIMAACF